MLKPFLLLLPLFVSSCALNTAYKISNADIPEILTFTNEELCKTQRDFPSYINHIARLEIQRRNLGDCSKAHVVCVDAGLTPNTEGFAQCKVGAYLLQMKLDAEHRRIMAQSLQQNLNNNTFSNPSTTPPNKRVTCTSSPNPFGNIVTDCREY